jgi:hypothetical protein
MGVKRRRTESIKVIWKADRQTLNTPKHGAQHFVPDQQWGGSGPGSITGCYSRDLSANTFKQQQKAVQHVAQINSSKPIKSYLRDDLTDPIIPTPLSFTKT